MLKTVLIDEAIKAHAKRTPNKLAIESKDDSMSYHDLECRANGIANILALKRGVKQQNVVLFMESSANLIAAIIGVLRAAEIFVPVDPDFPEERIRLLLNHVQPSCIITEAKYLDCLLRCTNEASYKIEILVIDDDQTTNSQTDNIEIYNKGFDSIELKFERNYQDYCYIYFTSGSTGTPKGVLGRYSSLAHFINWEIQQFSIDDTDRVSQLTNISFDPYLRDIFVPLVSGGTCCLISKEVRRDANLLILELEKFKITRSHMVPTLFKNILNELIQAQKINRVINLKTIFLAGELLRGEDVKKYFDANVSITQLVNLYGPTETTLAKFFHLVTPEDSKKAIVPVGRTISDAEGLILNEKFKLCDQGETGILYIKTVYRSGGYYNNVDATNKSFIRNPKSDDDTDIVYCTGDIVRELPSGDIELLGRNDNQVKIYGHRVEIGEIENTILGHPSVKEVTVIPKITNDNQRLCAYVVPKCQIDESEIKYYLEKHLPAYMVPSSFIYLDVIPLNENGKVDRKALVKKTESKKIAHPKNHIETRLIAIWADILKIDASEVSAENTFIELGGNSLKAIKIIDKVKKEFDISISVRQFFYSNKISSIANQISEIYKEREHEVSNKEQCYPLSYSQRRIFFACEIAGESPAYNISHAFMISGSLNLPRLKKSISFLADRHEVMKMVFLNQENGPVQYINNDIGINELYLEIQTDKDELFKITKAHAEQKFDLYKGPLVKFLVIKIDSDSYVLQFTMHHIIADAWSLDILLEELFLMYESKDGAPELPLKYHEYCVRDIGCQTSEHRQDGQAYWQKILSPDVPRLNLITDFNKCDVPANIGSEYELIISDETVKLLNDFSREKNLTNFIVLFCCFSIFLYKYSGQEDILVGVPVANRSDSDVENLIGCFVNMLPLRTQLKSSMSVLELLEQVANITFDSYQYQDFPIETIANQFKNSNAKTYSLFDIVFSMQSTESNKWANSEFKLGDLLLERYSIEDNQCKFPLIFTITPENTYLKLRINYANNLFAKERIQQYAKHFVQLLEALLKAPESEIRRLSMLSSAELDLITNKYVNPSFAYPRHETIHGIFEQIVKKYSNQSALVWKNKSYSYAEINMSANKLAHYLQTKNIGNDKIIGIFLERSVEQVIAILAILKTGNAYLPLDTRHPLERVKWILESSNAELLITSDQYFKAINTDISWVDINNSSIKLQSSENLENHIAVLSRAYVIFTSGTTGKPKGVEVMHKNVVQLLFHSPNNFSFDQNDIWTLFHSYCFDFSVWEMFGALLFGGKLIIVTDEEARDTELFAEVLRKEKVTVLNQTPTAFYNLIKEEQRHKKSDFFIRYVIFGGEALSPGRLLSWHNKYPETKFINMFGITETTVHVTYKEISLGEMKSNISNIGKPLPSYYAYIVDKDNNVVPPGVSGELIVGGEGVAKGYLNNPDITKEKFIIDPFHKNSIVYRTGDLAQQLFTGDLEYLGRNDQQVQLHGFRIELAEIEHALLNYQDISDARVFLREPHQEQKHLCAYIISKSEINTKDIKQYLLDRLPHYMVPSYFIFIDQFPRTINGKIDLLSLPEPEKNITRLDSKVELESAAEKFIASIWMKALKVNAVYKNDNFFDLGGDSISAMNAVFKSEGKFSLSDLFNNPVLEDLALKITHINDRQRYLSRLSALDTEAKITKKTLVLCIPFGGGDASDYKYLAEELSRFSKDYHVYGVELPGYGHSRKNTSTNSIEELTGNILSEVKNIDAEKIILYGHCVGTALTLSLAVHLENNGFPLSHVFIGAIYPPKFDPLSPVLDPWKNTSDHEIIKSLQDIGWNNSRLENDDVINAIVKNFRNDVCRFREFFYKYNDLEIRSPTIFVVGENDVTTAHDFDDRHLEWSKIASNLQSITIKDGDHYFIKSKPSVLAQKITEMTN